MGESVQERKKKEHEQHMAEIHKALEQFNKAPKDPTVSGSNTSMSSRAYREFKEDEEKSRTGNTFFEKMCNLSQRIVQIEIDKKSSDKIQEAIDFTNMKATPTGVASFAVMSVLFFLIVGVISLFIPSMILPMLIKIAILSLSFISALYILKYPENHATSVRIKTSGELVMVVLYMIVYMKTTPNLEGAVRFAAANAKGKIGRDLKRMLWQLEDGEISTIDEGLMDYVVQWKNYDREFMDSIEFIRASMRENNTIRRENLLDRAVQTILEGTDEKMKHYSRNLTMPINVIHGLGVLLPVMGMIIFPLASIFLGDSIPNIVAYLVFGYDIILPLIVFFVMKMILDRRPSTKTTVDISNHPDAVPIDRMKVAGKEVKVWPFAVIGGGSIVALGTILLVTFLNIDVAQDANPIVSLISSSMFHSIIIVFGIALGAAIYFRGTSFQKIGIIKEIQKIEEQFESALFALGNRLSGGTPLELALTKAQQDTEDLEISGLLRITVKNIAQLNMTFRQALFDTSYGALRYYPSKLIKTIMQSISEAVDKGTKSTSMTMLVISEYLRSIRTTQEKIDDLLSDVTSSMQFQAYILVPIISGVVVATAQIIMSMMLHITGKMDELKTASLSGSSPMDMLISLDSSTAPWLLQLIVGIYVVEILILLAMFIVKISEGEDKVKQNDMAWRVVIIGTTVYIIVLAIVSIIFGGLIDSALAVM